VPRKPVPRQVDLAALLSSRELALRAERKSPATVKVYGDGVRGFLSWCQATGREARLDRDTVTAFVADLLAGAEAATARSRQLALRRFSAWAAEEGKIPDDLLLALRPPKLDSKVVQPLTEDQLRDLLRACAGPTMRDKRHDAVVRMMAETGLRAGEVVGMEVADVNLAQGTAVVRRGKGGKGRIVPIGDKTCRALDRYLRARRMHRLADTRALWLGDRGRGFTYEALHRALARRAQLAGIPGFHPHLLRHTAAHRWLAAGGSEGGLMAVAGWTRPDMLLRYTRRPNHAPSTSPGDWPWETRDGGQGGTGRRPLA
jgi:integrase/recombinase XerD